MKIFVLKYKETVYFYWVVYHKCLHRTHHCFKQTQVFRMNKMFTIGSTLTHTDFPPTNPAPANGHSHTRQQSHIEEWIHMQRKILSLCVVSWLLTTSKSCSKVTSWTLWCCPPAEKQNLLTKNPASIEEQDGNRFNLTFLSSKKDNGTVQTRWRVPDPLFRTMTLYFVRLSVNKIAQIGQERYHSCETKFYTLK